MNEMKCAQKLDRELRCAMEDITRHMERQFNGQETTSPHGRIPGSGRMTLPPEIRESLKRRPLKSPSGGQALRPRLFPKFAPT